MIATIKKHIGFVLLFAVIVIIDIVMHPIAPELRLLTKGAICASLLIYYIIKVPPQNRYYIVGLIFAMAGDLFLAFDRGASFLLGLGCFLVMQICYIMIFKRAYGFPAANWQKIAVIGLAAIYFTFIFVAYNSLGSLLIPVIIYSLALATMVYLAICVRSKPVLPFLVVGSIFFLISDSLLGANKFIAPIPMERIWVMSTYGLAQLMICLGLIRSYEFGKS